MAKCLLDRCQVLDDHEEAMKLPRNNWQEQFLLQPNRESGYTPLHAAIVAKNLSAILLYLQYPTPSTGPMALLHAGMTDMTKAVDAEGLSALDLLGKLQVSNLRLCRSGSQQHALNLKSLKHRGQRSSSFEQVGYEEDDEFDVLRAHLHELPQVNDQTGTPQNGVLPVAQGFEVVTFGRPHHCALGVISSSSATGGATNLQRDNKNNSDANPAVSAATFRPQRVQEFAQERALREGSAVAIAAASHHTLVACRNGDLYVFGLNKGGRLGLGDDCPQQCPLPRRILALKRRKVVAVAAAENHSLCVTIDGIVFAWGSNQFGQLGDNPTGSTGTSSRSIPKPVDDMKQTPCIAVAAGERHSVALSREGEVYVWGNNTSGQLGVPRRSGVQKVQRVEALWANGSSSFQQKRKIAIAIAAADQSTLVLIAPVAGVTQVNSVYWWGHGNHVPMRIQFEGTKPPTAKLDLPGAMTATQRLINPVAIACAKYHNAAVTMDGCVYTWGTSSESLGRENAKTPESARSTTHRATTSPQLVTGMLPENGGGFAVAVSASEQHTAVVTNTGALFTWGVAQGKNVMGHEGVRWQPSPKRVPGIHRAVGVAVAKEHTVVLIGTTFPAIRHPNGLSTLEHLSAHAVAQHVDLFNVVPILIMAEHIQSDFLIEYCSLFIRDNLDGVLNFTKKSVLNQYLNAMLAKSMHHTTEESRDNRHHPFITDAITAGHKSRSSFQRAWMSSIEEWVAGCQELSLSPGVQQLLASLRAREQEEESTRFAQRRERSSSLCARDMETAKGRSRALSCSSETENTQQVCGEGTLDKIINKTATMDLSTAELAQEKSTWLAKEIRGVRKKLSQISKLRESESKSIVLTADERAKLERRPVLEAELHIYQTALEEVERRIHELLVEGQAKTHTAKNDDTAKQNEAEIVCQKKEVVLDCNQACDPDIKVNLQKYTCNVCSIKCPDKTSFELHQNGRKHRNRVAQVEEEEKQKTAQSIMAKKELGSVHMRKDPPLPVQPVAKNAWGISNSPQPKYKLPPPPHPVVAQVSTPINGPPKNHNVSTQRHKLSPSTDFPCIAREQVSKQKVSKSSNPTIASPSSVVKTSASPTLNRSPFHLHPAPNRTQAPLPSNQRNTVSIGDFLAPKEPATSTPKKGPAKSWTSPIEVTKVVSSKPKTLAEIQAEEVDFKAREDRAYKAGDGRESSWFIERRERADSLHAIQEAAARERETQLMIQEQFAIEAQIQAELAAQHKKQAPQQQKKSAPHEKKQKKRNNANKSLNGPVNKEATNDQNGQDSAQQAPKPPNQTSSQPLEEKQGPRLQKNRTKSC